MSPRSYVLQEAFSDSRFSNSELEPFHEAGKLPPSEERKEIVKKIRARTLSRASQMSQSGLASGLALASQSPMTTTSSNLAAPADALLLNPKDNENPQEAISVVQDTEIGKAVASDSEDTAWMHSDGSEPKPSKKQKKKKLKKKAALATVTRSTGMSTSDHEAEITVANSKQPTGPATQDLIAVADIYEEDGTQGEWSTVSKPKAKKKDEIDEKNVSRVQRARSLPKKTESSKIMSKKSEFVKVMLKLQI